MSTQFGNLHVTWTWAGFRRSSACCRSQRQGHRAVAARRDAAARPKDLAPYPVADASMELLESAAPGSGGARDSSSAVPDNRSTAVQHRVTMRSWASVPILPEVRTACRTATLVRRVQWALDFVAAAARPGRYPESARAADERRLPRARPGARPATPMGTHPRSTVRCKSIPLGDSAQCQESSFRACARATTTCRRAHPGIVRCTR